MSQPLEKLEKEIQEAIANNGFHVNAINKVNQLEAEVAQLRPTV